MWGGRARPYRTNSIFRGQLVSILTQQCRMPPKTATYTGRDRREGPQWPRSGPIHSRPRACWHGAPGCVVPVQQCWVPSCNVASVVMQITPRKYECFCEVPTTPGPTAQYYCTGAPAEKMETTKPTESFLQKTSPRPLWGVSESAKGQAS